MKQIYTFIFSLFLCSISHGKANLIYTHLAQNPVLETIQVAEKDFLLCLISRGQTELNGALLSCSIRKHSTLRRAATALIDVIEESLQDNAEKLLDFQRLEKRGFYTYVNSNDHHCQDFIVEPVATTGESCKSEKIKNYLINMSHPGMYFFDNN